MRCHNSLLKELSMSCVTPLGERTLSACAWFPSDFTPCTFPLADFALCPFAVINQSNAYNYILSPASPPSKSLNLAVVLGTLTCLGMSNCFSIICQKDFFPLEFSCHLCQKQLTINIRIYFWILFCSIAFPYANTTS